MIKVDLTLDNELMEQLRSHLEYFASNNGKTVAPQTMNAFNMATREIQKTWQNWSMGGSIDGALNIKNPSPNIARSIKVNKQNDFSAEIYSENQQMVMIQEGRKAQDMKLTYPYGKKSRVSKNNVPYLIIPFRWGTHNKEGGARAHFTNMISTDIHNFVKKKSFVASLRTGSIHNSKNAMGNDVQRSEYEWGDRYEGEGNINGLVKMQGNTYFTFRIISANSQPESWWKKAVPANNVVGALATNLSPKVAKIVEEGLKADLGDN